MPQLQFAQFGHEQLHDGRIEERQFERHACVEEVDKGGFVETFRIHAFAQYRQPVSDISAYVNESILVSENMKKKL